MSLGFSPDPVLAGLKKKVDHDMKRLNDVMAGIGGSAGHDFPPDEKTRMALDRVTRESDRIAVRNHQQLRQADKEAMDTTKRTLSLMFRMGKVIELFGRLLGQLESGEVRHIPDLLESIRQFQR